jgi:hypothetical protein
MRSFQIKSLAGPRCRPAEGRMVTPGDSTFKIFPKRDLREPAPAGAMGVSLFPVRFLLRADLERLTLYYGVSLRSRGVEKGLRSPRGAVRIFPFPGPTPDPF